MKIYGIIGLSIIAGVLTYMIVDTWFKVTDLDNRI